MKFGNCLPRHSAFTWATTVLLAGWSWVSPADLSGSRNMGGADISWELGPDLPVLRKGSAVGVLDGKIISAGGMHHPWEESAAVYAYTPGEDHWDLLPPMPEGRYSAMGVTFDGAFYVLGGRWKSTTSVRPEPPALRA